MQTAEVRLYDLRTGRRVDTMGVEPIKDAESTLEWCLKEFANTGEPLRPRLIRTGSW